jgi:fimbrial isopeptide formation D2 family protein/LPXTG-motif cell wall-anchored protein
MKNFNRLIAILLAAAMIMGMSLTAMAEEKAEDKAAAAEVTGTITITPPANTPATASNAYKIYKVFDASGDGSGKDGKISYRLVEGKTEAPKGFAVDKAGNVSYEGTSKDGTLTPEDIEAIKAYVTESDLVDTVEAEGSAAVRSKALKNGYYYITTTTGTVVTIDSTNPDVTVEDKNSVPEVSKKITGASSVDIDGKKALAQIGTEVSFEAEIIVGKGAVNYVFHDEMDDRLSYNGNAEVWNGENEVSTDNYDNTREGDDTLTISFKNEYISTLTAGTKLVIRYTATVTEAALTQDPAKNTAYVSYGDKNGSNSTPVSETETYNAKFTITKHDGEEKPLAGAGFVIKNADGKYYRFNEAAEAAEAQGTEGEEGYVPAREAAEASVSWVEDIKDATEYVSDSEGVVPAFTGLANGTYTVIENTVPEGYNKAEDSTFTIEEHDYTDENLNQKATVINKAGIILPHTGGIGTTIFNVIGTILVIGAGVMLVARRRMNII